MAITPRNICHVYVNASVATTCFVCDATHRIGPFGGRNHLQRPRRRSVRRGFVAGWRVAVAIEGAQRKSWKITMFTGKIHHAINGKLTIWPFSIAM